MLGHLGYVKQGGSIGVGIFLLLSGYGIHLSKQNKGLENYWKKKFYKVYIPYIFATLIWIGICFPLEGGLKSAFISILGLDLDVNIDATMWYISFLFLWYLLYWVIFRICKIKENFGIVVLMLMGIAIFILNVKYHIFFHRDAGVYLYTMFFPIGVLLAQVEDCLINRKSNIIKSILPLVCLAMLCCVIRYYNNINNPIQRMLFTYCGVSLVFIIGFRCKRCANLYLANGFKFLGLLSYEMYLFEGKFIYIQEKFMLGNIKSLVEVIIFFTLVVGTSWIFKNLIVQPMILDHYK